MMGGRREAGWEECGRQHRGQQRISCCCGFFDLEHSLNDSMAEVLMSDSYPENDRASRDVSLAAYPRGSDANFGDEIELDALSHFVRGCSKQAKAGRSFSSDHRCTKLSTTISRMPCPPPEFDTTCLPSSSQNPSFTSNGHILGPPLVLEKGTNAEDFSADGFEKFSRSMARFESQFTTPSFGTPSTS
jgi:hypothetical protein